MMAPHVLVLPNEDIRIETVEDGIHTFRIQWAGHPVFLQRRTIAVDSPGGVSIRAAVFTSTATEPPTRAEKMAALVAVGLALRGGL